MIDKPNDSIRLHIIPGPICKRRDIWHLVLFHFPFQKSIFIELFDASDDRFAHICPYHGAVREVDFPGTISSTHFRMKMETNIRSSRFVRTEYDVQRELDRGNLRCVQCGIINIICRLARKPFRCLIRLITSKKPTGSLSGHFDDALVHEDTVFNFRFVLLVIQQSGRGHIPIAHFSGYTFTGTYKGESTIGMALKHLHFLIHDQFSPFSAQILVNLG